MGKLAEAASQTRTFALVGHRSSGKTSLAECMLEAGGAVRRAGAVEEGTTLLDHLPAERSRHMSLEAGFAWLAYREQLLYLIDVPGGAASAPERAIAGAGGDLQVLVASVTDGIEQGTRRVLGRGTTGSVLAVITKMDRVHSHGWRQMVDALAATAVGQRVQLLQLPYFEAGEFAGIIDLIQREVVLAGGARMAVPPELRAEVAVAREALVESVALCDDALLESYLEFFELDDALLEEGLARAVDAGRLLPVCFAAPTRNIGAHPLLDAIARFGPAPIARPVPLIDADGAVVIASEDGPFAAQLLATHLDASGEPFHILRVWSGTAPRRGAWEWEGGQRGVRKLYSIRGPRRKVAVYSGPGAIVATWDRLTLRPGDVVYQGQSMRPARPVDLRPAIERRVQAASPRMEDRLRRVLDDLVLRDRGAVVRRDNEGVPILGGVNSMHLERMLSEVRFDVDIETSLPMVPYREAPRRVARAEYVHEKIVGGEPLEFARVVLVVRPLESSGYRFRVDAHHEDLPDKWHAAIERGVHKALSNGPQAGYPVDGIDITCVDGDYDLFASEEAYFEIAAGEALMLALEEATTELIEPLFEVVVEVPSERVGDVLTELGHRGGRVIGLESPGRHTRISAEMPYRQLRTLGPRLEAVTSGESRLEAAQRRMAPVPAQAVAQAVQESPHPIPQRRAQARDRFEPAVAASPG